MANIECAGTGNIIRLKKRVLTGPWPTLVPLLQATKALVCGQYNSMQYNIVSHGVIGTKHKLGPRKESRQDHGQHPMCQHLE